MVEFNRQSLALLQKIKKLAKDEQGCVIHYDSPDLENELRSLVASGVSTELLTMIEEFLPTQEPSSKPGEGRSYRGTETHIDDSARTKKSVRIYRGQVVTD